MPTPDLEATEQAMDLLFASLESTAIYLRQRAETEREHATDTDHPATERN